MLTSEDREFPKGARVLVAEDDDAFRNLLIDVLSAEGMILLAAADGPGYRDLIAALSRGELVVDLVISDVYMPGYSGTSGLLDLSRLTHRPHVILMSAHADPGLYETAQALGASALLTKPFALEELRAAIVHAFSD